MILEDQTNFILSKNFFSNYIFFQKQIFFEILLGRNFTMLERLLSISKLNDKITCDIAYRTNM